MVWPATAQTIRTELENNIPTLAKKSGGGVLSHDYVADFVRIGEFLASKDQVRQRLRNLEEDITNQLFGGKEAKLNKPNAGLAVIQAQADAKAHFDGWQARLTAPQKNVAKKSSEFSHLLTGALGAIERRAGFVVHEGERGHQPYKVMLMFPIDSKGFMANMRAGRHWKDTVNPDHGEYTHRLQWCLLIKAAVVKNPLKVFQHLGGLASWPDGSGRTFHVWDAFFDRVPPGTNGFGPQWPFYAEHAEDFRSPERLLAWLCLDEQQKAYPLVAGFLKARREKRLHQMQGAGFGNENYAALKVFKKPFDELDPAQQKRLMEIVVGSYTSDGAKTYEGLLAPTKSGYRDPKGRL